MDGASIRKAYDDAQDDAPASQAGSDIRAAFNAAEPPEPEAQAPAIDSVDTNIGLPLDQQTAMAGTAVNRLLDWRQANLDRVATAVASGDSAAGNIFMGPANLGVGGGMSEAYLARLTGKALEQPANRLAAVPANDVAPVSSASPAPAPVAPGGNPLAPQPEAVNPLVPPPESVATPTTAPKAKLLPIRTPAQADAEADRIIRHFAGNGNTTIDTASAIPGSKPTLSQAIVGGNPGIASLETTARDMSPNDFVARETANQQARADHLVSVIGTPADLAAAEAERDALTAKAKATAFSNPQPTDPTPAIQQIDAILKSGQGQRTTVANALKDIRSKLVDAKGNLQTDPEQLYGIRQHINDIISPKAAGTASDARAAARELMTVKDALDPVIEQGAPGFTHYIQQYESLSRPINGMQALQNMQLTDAQGNIQLGRLNTNINALERQQKLPGARLADSVTDEQLAQLKALRDDFRRDSKQQLGKSLGSPTFQKLGTNRVMETLGHPLVGGVGLTFGATTNPIIAGAGLAARYGLQKMDAKGQAMVLDALRRKLLNPDLAATSFRPR
jgi:hypothetical protein